LAGTGGYEAPSAPVFGLGFGAGVGEGVAMVVLP